MITCISTKINSELSLEDLYELYPRKRGRTKGLAKARREIKTEKDYNDLKKAIENYSSEVSGSDQQFIMYFSTFMNQWRDWYDIEIEEKHVVDIAKLRGR